MGGEAVGIVRIICPSTGECQGQEAGVGRVRERGGEGIGGFGIAFEMLMKKISNKNLLPSFKCLS